MSVLGVVLICWFMIIILYLLFYLIFKLFLYKLLLFLFNFLRKLRNEELVNFLVRIVVVIYKIIIIKFVY